MAADKNEIKLATNDRVKRTSGEGCHGIVKEVRAETTAAASKEKPLLVLVQWDNGTASYFAPESLTKVA